MQVRIEIPQKVNTVLRTLNHAGYEAYIVGGCVRDALLGRVPEDWDITTSARPAEVKALFRRTVDTGIQHGTVTVLLGRDSYEVTTYRIDGIYEDGRHPKKVSFTSRLSDDLMRRDFTINAMAWHPEEGLVDCYGGLRDLKEKRIRAVGVPEERFEEDALRILRAVRFSAQLDFAIEPATRAAITKFAPRLHLISRERIRTELTKLLRSDHPEKFLALYETGLTAVLFPEFDLMMEMPQNNPYHCYSVGMHTLAMLAAIPADPVLRWTALLHDVGKLQTHSTDEKGIDHFYGHAAESAKFAEHFLRELRFDNQTIREVTLLVRWHDPYFDLTQANVRRAMHRVGAERFPALLTIVRADTQAKSDFAKERLLPRFDTVERLYEEILRNEECTCLKDLAVSGNDLIAAGMRPGREIGETLERLLALVLEHPEENTKEKLLAKIR